MRLFLLICAQIFLICFIPICQAEFKKVSLFFDEEDMTLLYKGKLYKLNNYKSLESLEENLSLAEENVDPNIKNSALRKASEGKVNNFKTQNNVGETSMEAIAGEGRSRYTSDEAEFWYFVIVSAVLSCFAGLCSGLTVGYLSIDDLVLDLKQNNGTPEEIKSASKIMPIIQEHHWLLVTLLLANAFALEALPIFLEAIVPAAVAILISVIAVLIFGEIIPQAICTGPDQIKIAAFLAPVTKFLMYILSPIGYPLALILDNILGEHHKRRFQNSDLKTLIELHSIQALEELQHLGFEEYEDMGLKPSQTNLIIGAIDLHKMKVENLLIPYEEAVCISLDEKLSPENIQRLLKSGRSRFPVYKSKDRNNIVGIFLIKKLIGMQFSENDTFQDLQVHMRRPLFISKDMSLNELMMEFLKGRNHMAIVTEGVVDHPDILYHSPPTKEKNIRVIGIATLEDVLEDVLKTEIYDEDDYDKQRPAFHMGIERHESHPQLHQMTQKEKPISNEHDNSRRFLAVNIICLYAFRTGLIKKGERKGRTRRKSMFYPEGQGLEMDKELESQLLSTKSFKDRHFQSYPYLRLLNQRAKTHVPPPQNEYDNSGMAPQE